MKKWQLSFEVKGLVAPINGILFDDVLFKRARRTADRTMVESDDL